LFLLAASITLAQNDRKEDDKRDDRKDVKKNVVEQRPLIIALAGKPDLNEEKVVGRFDKALQNNNREKKDKPDFTWRTPIKPRRIDKATYQALQHIVENVESVIAPPDRTKVSLKSSKESEPYWEFDLGKDAAVQAVKVTFKEKGKGEKTYVKNYVKDKKTEGVLLEAINGERGQYGLFGKLEDTPVQNVIVLAGDKEMAPESWPREENSYWLVKLEGWEGDHRILFDVMADGELTTLPVAVNPKVATLGVGTLVLDGPIPEQGFNGLQFVFRVPMVKGTSKAGDEVRAWMLFPLTEEKAREIAAKIDKRDVGKVLTEEIPEKDRILAPDPAKNEKEKVTLKPNDNRTLPEAKWYELRKQELLFERTLTVEDVAKWPTDKPVYRVIVWEVLKKGQRTAEAVPVGDGNCKPEEVNEWAPGLRNLAEKDQPKKDKDK